MNVRWCERGGGTWQLDVPLFWDAINQEWAGAVILPKSRRIVRTHGKTVDELESNFGRERAALFTEGGGIAQDFFSLFTPCE